MRTLATQAVFATLVAGLSGCTRCCDSQRLAASQPPVPSEISDLSGIYVGGFGPGDQNTLTLELRRDGSFLTSVDRISIVVPEATMRFSSGFVARTELGLMVHEMNELEYQPGSISRMRWPTGASDRSTVVSHPPRVLMRRGEEIMWPLEWPLADDPVRFALEEVVRLRRVRTVR